MSDKLEHPVFLSRWLERAERSVGVITVLLSIASFGIGVLVGGPISGAFVALVAFGLIGALEVFHV